MSKAGVQRGGEHGLANTLPLTQRTCSLQGHLVDIEMAQRIERELCIVLSVNSILPVVCWAGSVGA